MNKLKILSLVAIIILSITSALAQESEAQVAITLERTPCFGACPVYTVTIFDDGTVIYNGENFVDVLGEQTGQIEPETVQLMLDAFESAGYFGWDEAYDAHTITDLPTITTSVTRDDQTHQIIRYAGDSSVPLALPYLEQWVDEMANTGLWTGVQSEIANTATMNSPVITLERGACFGFCPIYKVALFEDGTGVYMGIANVDHIGVHVLEIEPSSIMHIAQIAEISGYFDWQDNYDKQLMTDQSTVITTMQTEDHFKRIARYGGDPNAPIGLVWIEDSIDQLFPRD